MTMSISDDSKIPQLLAELAVLGRGDVTVGFHADKKARRQEGDSTNAEVAAAHEFGTDEIERRPFLAPALEQGKAKIVAVQEQVAAAVLDGKMQSEQALGLVGEIGVTLIKAKIGSNIPPALKPETAAAKGSSNTLIDTGQMRAAVSYEVNLLGGDRGR